MDGETLTIEVFAFLRVANEPRFLAKAVERLSAKSEAEIIQLAAKIVEAQVRHLVSIAAAEEIHQDRATWRTKLMGSLRSELAPVGLRIDALTIGRLSGPAIETQGNRIAKRSRH